MTPKIRPPRRPAPRAARECARLLATLPPGRRRVAQALLVAGGRTYGAVARHLHLHLGTVYQHLRRIRLRHPQVYAALHSERARQLGQRHQQALARAALHTLEWERLKDQYRTVPVDPAPPVGSRAWTEWVFAGMDLDLDLDLGHHGKPL